MNLKEQKEEVIKLLQETESEELIAEVKSVLEKRETDFWDELPQHVKESITLSLKQAEEGNTIPHEVVKERILQKYGLKT